MNYGNLVSICIPVYNGEKYLAETLDTIITQTYKNIEIIIGDNCSTDFTESIIRTYMDKDARIQYIKNEINLGYAGNCNNLIKNSNGVYVAIYHADDLYDSRIIEKQVIVLDENPGFAGVFTLGTAFNDKNKLIKCLYDFPKHKEKLIEVDRNIYINKIFALGGSILICPTSMIRKTVYIQTNGYSEALRYIEDQDMWLRILMDYKLGVVNEPLIKYRIHGQQGSQVYKNNFRQTPSLVLVHIETFLSNNGLINEYKNLLEEKKESGLHPNGNKFL